MSPPLLNVTESTGGAEIACKQFHGAMYEMHLRQTLCDVTLLDSQNEVTHAHSVVLASGSEVLKSALMLKQSQNMIRTQGLTIKIVGVNKEVWTRVLEFLYLRRVNVPLEGSVIQGLYAAAKKLGVKPLASRLQGIVSTLGLGLDLSTDPGEINITLAPTTPSNNKDFSSQVSGEEITKAVNYVLREHTYTSGCDVKKEDVSKKEHTAIEPRFTVASRKFKIETGESDDEGTCQEGNSVLEEGELYLPDVTAQMMTSEGEPAPRAVRCIYCRKVFSRKHQLVSHISEACSHLKRNTTPAQLDIKRKHEEGGDGVETGDEDDGDVDLRDPDSEPPPAKKAARTRKVNPVDKTLVCLNPSCGLTFPSHADLNEHHRQCLMADTSYSIDDYFTTLADGTLSYSDPYFDPSKPGAIDNPTARPEPMKEERKPQQKLRGPPRTPQYICNHCTSTVKILKKHKMLMHLAQMHGKRTPFHCKLCPAKFTYIDAFKDHYSGRHSGVLAYTCDECGEAFARNDTLKRHRLYLHKRQGKPSFMCSFCGEKFHNPQARKRHEQYHLPEAERRRYPCTICNKVFMSKDDLRQHGQIHGVVRHQCAHCAYACRRRGNLLLHERRSHGVHHGTVSCELCANTFTSIVKFNKHDCPALDMDAESSESSDENRAIEHYANQQLTSYDNDEMLSQDEATKGRLQVQISGIRTEAPLSSKSSKGVKNSGDGRTVSVMSRNDHVEMLGGSEQKTVPETVRILMTDEGHGDSAQNLTQEQIELIMAQTGLQGTDGVVFEYV